MQEDSVKKYCCCFTKHMYEILYVPVLLTLYVVSGAIQPIVLEYIKKEGGAEPLAMLYPVPNSIAMAMVLVVPQAESRVLFIKQFWKQAILMSIIDVAATSLTLFGQLLCGSGIYIIIYSSLTIWSAIGSKVTMKKKFNWIQIVGIGVVTIGLMVSGISAFAGPQNENNTDVIIGIVITLVGTVLHSCVYWLNEYFNFKSGMSMQLICGYSGIFGVGLYLVYLCAYTFPNYQKLLIDPVDEASGQWVPNLILLYPALIVVDLLHVFCQYTVVPRAGSVTMGIAKAISSMIVFVFSHILFCAHNENQCIDVFKGCSLGIVLAGVIIYSAATKKKVKKFDGDGADYKDLNDQTETEKTATQYSETVEQHKAEQDDAVDTEKQPLITNDE